MTKHVASTSVELELALKSETAGRFTTRRKIATDIERLPPESINRRSKPAPLIVDRPSQKDISYLLPYVAGPVGGVACVARVGQWRLPSSVSLGSHGQTNIRFRQI